MWRLWLAYASWKYTSEYKGNVYQPVIFNALGQTSESFVSRNLHKGGVTKIVQSSDGKNSYVSVSNYGEVNRWRYDEGFVGNEVLFSNPNIVSEMFIGMKIMWCMPCHTMEDACHKWEIGRDLSLAGR